MTTGDQKSNIQASGLTTDDLLALLACGETLELADGTSFVIEDEKERMALAWFLGDPVGKRYLAAAPERGNADMAGLVAWMGKAKVPTKPAVAAPADDKRVWSLGSLTIRQFGGLQPFCMPDGSDAPDITLPISRPLFLAQGPNGAGKSSLARVLTFLLTGKVASTPDFQHFADAGQINTYDLADGSNIQLPTVVPMPTLPQWQARSGKGEPVTTAVTAVFKADDGTETTICRKVVQERRGFSTVLEKDGAVVGGVFPAALGVSPLAVELSALHMARLAHLKLGQRESLADGVRALTGLRGVAELAERTAPTIKNYLGTTYARNQRTQAETAAANFRQQIAVLAEAFKDAAPPPLPPVPAGDGNECRIKLADLKKDLDERASKVRAAVAAAAGIDEDKVELDGLDDNLVRAIDLLSDPTLNSAGLAALVAAAENLSDEDVGKVRDAIAETVKRANDFAALQAEALKTKRRRHHARIATGLKEDGLAIPPVDCPTCLRALDDTVVDDVLAMPVAAAIAAGADETEDLKFTLEQFIDAARTKLLNGISDPVMSCVKLLGKLSDAPSPAGWAASVAGNIDTALTAFSALKHLAAQANRAFGAKMADLPECPVSALPALDPIFEGTSVDKANLLLAGLLDLRNWARSTRDARAKLVNETYGVVPEAIPAESLAGKVNELRSLLNDYRPVSTAKEVLKALTNHYDAWGTARKAAEDAVAAAEAVGRLAALKRVVDVQVDGLFRDLNADMDRYWRMFYQAPGHAGPQAGLVRYDGVALHIPAEVEGAIGSANNIANSSQVRALLFSFVLALLQSVWKRSGGLSLVLLDDPQLLFDERNQVRLAKGLVSCTNEKFRPMIMTFDRVFTARVARAGDCRMGAALSDQVEAYRIVPRGKIHECVRLELDELTLNSYRDEWQRDEANGAKIKVFCNEARSFMEHTLVNLLAEAAEPVHDHPTLEPLRVRVQNLVKRPGAVQNAEPFRQLLDLLPDGNPAKETLAQALQWSHHFQGYEDLTQVHAKAVDDMLDRFMDLREQCLDILVNRVAPRPVPMAANANDPVVGAPAPAATVRVIGLAAASEGDTGPGADADVPEVGTHQAGKGEEYRPEADLPPVGDQIRTINPETHHAFGVGKAAQWLPFPLQESSMVICERDPRAPKKGEFAIVADRNLGKAHIGWCRMDGESILVAGFGGKFINAAPAASCDVFPVVGAIFDGGATDPTPCHPLDKPEVMGGFGNAAQISEGDSAEPLLLKGNLVLLDTEVPGADVFGAAEGSIFAVKLGDGRWVIKRVSGPANKPYRHLLPLGMLGAGEIVTIAPGEFGLTVARAFPVVGFLR